MQSRCIVIISLFLLALPSSHYLINSVNAADDIYEPGFVEWDINNHHRVYLTGAENEVNLTRDYQAASMGNVEIRSGQPASIGPISLPPLEMGFSGTFNISTYISAWVQAGTGLPLLQCRTQNPVNLDVTVTIGSFTYIASTQEFVYESSGDAHNLSTEVQMENITALPGDSISYSMQASTNCPYVINLEWGGSGVFSGGIILEGDLFSPEVEVTVDDARIAHIQFVASLPWGFDDLDQDYTSMNIYGPVAPDEKRIFDEDMRPEGFTATSEYIERIDDWGRPAKVFTGKVALPEGDNVLIVCLKTVDSQNFNTPCDHEGIIRFAVEGDDEPFATAFIWLSISGFLAVIAYLFFLIRQGILLPLQIIGALVIFAILMLPLAANIPDLGGDQIVEDDARAPSFILQQLGNESVSLDDLLDGKDAVIIGITLPASINAVDQSNQIQNAVDRLDGSVSAVQIITGENTRLDDLETIASLTNSSWPVLMDDGESRFANRMPHGVSDSIVIIDKSGHITYSQPGSASSEDLIEAVENIGYGGQQSVWSILSLLWGPGLAMLLVALPRKSYEKPEEALMPGSLWGSVALAGGLGFLMVNITSLILAFIPADNDFRTWFDLGLVVWFVSAAIRAALVGTPKEISWISGKLHSLFSDTFRNWRDVEDFERDMLIGFWMGWFIWFANPAILAQGVAAVILTGGFNYLIGFFYLMVYVLMAGLLTLSIRFVASWGGPISRAFGSFGSGPFAEALGWAMIPVSLWILSDTVIYAMSIGIF